MSDLLSFIFSQGEQFRRVRLPSLYSDFTLQRTSNPHGYAANIAAWTEALSKATQAGLLSAPGSERDTLSLRTGEVLLRCLETREWGRPLALGTVIDEAVSQRQMMPYQEFISSRKSIYSRNWTIHPWWLLSWGMKQLGITESSTIPGQLPVGRFVVMRNVEEAASKILKHLGNESNPINRIYPIPIFSSEATRILNTKGKLSESDLQVILVYLARDKSAVIYDNQTVKFKGPGDTSSTLSTQDKTIASLKTLIADMNSQIALLARRISKLSENARAAVENKNTISARAALRSKKLNEIVLAQRTEALLQLEEIYGKIEQAADQVAILRVMEASAGVLQSLNADAGGVEKVEDLVEILRDEMSKVDDVSSAIDAGSHENRVSDEDGIDEELESLERPAKAEQEEKEAQLTAERLAGIGGNGGAKAGDVLQQHEGSKTMQSSPEGPDEAQDRPMEEGIRALNRLSLEEPRPGPEGNANETAPSPASRVLHAVSPG